MAADKACVSPMKTGATCGSCDGNSSRQFPRQPKKRENYGRPPYEQAPHRGISQKYRFAEDKRPRPRGFSRQRDDLNEDRYEVNLYSGRKVNLNHLLNFTYDHVTGGNESRPYTHYGGRKKSGYSSSVHYNKEQFLQANCQFIVNEDGDYTIHGHNPDTLVDWDKVEMIRVFGHEVSSCPICLEEPVAAKMTRCGHIYCWSCILHYLALGEKAWRKCPICYESVLAKDLKSVVTKEIHHFKVGESITMRLMRREKGSVIPVPDENKTEQGDQFYNVLENEKKTCFAKLLLASKQDVKKLALQPERDALEVQLALAEPSEIPFIEGAIDTLNEREEIMFMGKVSKIASKKEGLIVDSPPNIVGENKSSSTVSKTASKVYTSAFDDVVEEESQEHGIKEGEDQDILNDNNLNLDPRPQASVSLDSASLKLVDGKVSPEGTPEEVETSAAHGSPENSSIIPPPSIIMQDSLPVEEAAENLEMPLAPDLPKNSRQGVEDNAYYFYQADDGQHIYLNAINARCLVKEYGTLSMCPPTITASVIEMERVFMTEDLRKRLRYLRHVPLTCEFQVAELMLKPPIVSKDTLKFFHDDIEKRRRHRQKKNRQEKQWNRRAQEQERKSLGLSASRSTIVKSSFAAGVLSDNRPDSPTAHSDISSTSSCNTPIGSPGAQGPINPSEDDGEQTSNISFAQMLKSGKVQQQSWPKVKKVEDATPVREAVGDSDESDNEDKVPVPVYSSSFGTALDIAFENLAKTPTKGSEEGTDPTPSSGGSRKKRKQQKLLLFSTAMARGGK